MANGFQIQGLDINTRYYWAKSGPLGNVSPDPENPSGDATQLGQGNKATAVIGTGTWRWCTGFSGGNPGAIHRYVADGIVKFLGDRATRYQTVGFQGMGMTDISLEQFAGFAFQTYDSNPSTYSRCVFKVLPAFALSPNSGYSGIISFDDCIFFNVNFGSNVGMASSQLTSHNRGYFNRCLFFNCTFDAPVGAMNFCYIDPTTSAWATAANRNNVDPRCNPANSQGLKVGTGAYALTSPQGISALPGFNAPAKEDFSLTKDSAHIINGVGPAHLRYANTFFMEFLGGTGEPATLSNLRIAAASSAARVPLAEISTGANSFEVNNQGGVVLTANSNGDGFATMTTNRIPFSDIPLEMTVMRMIAGLNFDTEFPGTEAQISLAAPHIFNNNVPDYSNGVSGSATRKPNRLSYRMRWSTLTDPNIADPSHWVTGASFIEFGWNQKPLWNTATLIGNGDPAYDISTPSSVFARFYQLQVRLRNNYYSK